MSATRRGITTRLIGALMGGILALTLSATITQAQTDGYLFRAEMVFDSAFIRALPTTEAEAVASIFEDNIVEVVGRNLDGTWYEVRRPGRSYNLGWLLAEFLDFDEGSPERLPLTDFTTGFLGGMALTSDSGYATYAVDNLVLRDSPVIRTGRQIGTIPAGAVVPVIYRNSITTWLYVNYLGATGWVATFNTRPALGIDRLPIAPGLSAAEEIGFITVPPEVQRAEIARMRAYLGAAREVAVGLESLWYSVFNRTIMPCEPPDYVRDYAYTSQDTREFPELGRYLPRLEDVAQRLNAAIEPLTRCGVFDRDVAVRARSSAINARIAADATLDAILLVEERIRD